MIGTWINTGAIVAGGLAGLAFGNLLTPTIQQRLRTGLAGLTTVGHVVTYVEKRLGKPTSPTRANNKKPVTPSKPKPISTASSRPLRM